MRRIWLRTVFMIGLLLIGAGAAFAQSDTEDGEGVPLYSEVLQVTLPEDWFAEPDDEFEVLFIGSVDLNLGGSLYDSLADTTDIDATTPVDEAMVLAYEEVFGAVIDADDVAVIEQTETLTIGSLEFSPDNISLLAIDSEMEFVVLLDMFDLDENPISEEQLEATLAVLETVSLIKPDDEVVADADKDAAECVITVDESGTVRMRVGPGENRSAIAFLEAGEYTPEGQAGDNDGNQWFRMDREAVAPGSSANELWIAAADVDATDGCNEIEIVGAPPVIPGVAAPPPAASSGGDSGSTAASGNDGSAAAPASGGTQMLGGTYTLSYNPTVAGNCVGFESVTFSASELGLTSDTFRVSPSGSNLIVGSNTLTLQGNGEYFGTVTFDDGTNGQVYLRPTSNTSLQGQVITNFTLEGNTCSLTAGVTLAR
ncbi:MAG: hypothetical protein AAFR56_17970 [Chloroflexota bacterium]